MTPDTVLLVDDDQQLGRFTAEVLDLAGFKVELTTLGRDGLERVTAEPGRYQAVVLDRRLPDLDGLTILNRMKGNSATRDIPVVLLTGLASERDITDGIDAGAYYYVTKPFRESMLQAVVRAAIDDYQARANLRKELASTADAIGLLHEGEFRFRTPHQARVLAALLAHCTANPGAVVTGLWELMINAVEHGNLDISYQEKSALLGSGQWQNEICRRLAAPDYADKHVTVQVELGAREVSYTITDQGHGFDPLPYFEFEPGRATHAHGRGIAMARRLSFSSLEYFGNGNAVRATSARAEHSEQPMDVV
ncbi:MAG: response regulator [Proteobacteria bacterium]|nr:response regulator [Pseudomonadota bacterium]